MAFDTEQVIMDLTEIERLNTLLAAEKEGRTIEELAKRGAAAGFIVTTAVGGIGASGLLEAPSAGAATPPAAAVALPGYHIVDVEKGQVLSEIAATVPGMTLPAAEAAIEKATPAIVDPNKIYVNEQLQVPNGTTPAPVEASPAAPAPAAPEAPVVSASASHAETLTSGETIWALAQQQGFTLAQWQALNPGVNPGRVFAGESYTFPTTLLNEAVTPPTGSTDNNAVGKTIVTVPASGTVWNYAVEQARAIGESIPDAETQIMQTNSITNPKELQPGQQLIVETGSTPAAAPAPVEAVPAAPTPTSQPIPGKNGIFVVGDSLTVGMENGGLVADLQAKGYTVNKVEATVGDSVAAAIPKIEADASQVAASATIVNELGTNNCDLAESSPACETMPEFEGQEQNLIATERKLNPGAAIYDLNTYSTEQGGAVVAPINQAISAEAGPLGYKIIDWYTEAATHPSEYSFDSELGVHQTTDAGYQKMAEFEVSQIPEAPTTPVVTPAPVAAPAPVAQPAAATPAAPAPKLAQIPPVVDPVSDTTVAPVPAAQATDEGQIILDLEADGLSLAGASGVGGNFNNESAFQPERLESTYGVATPANALTPAQKDNPGIGWGLPQFTPAAKFIDPTEAAGLNPNDPQVQMKFMLGQIAGSNLLHELESPTISPTQAAYDFEVEYERPGSLSDAPKREQAAADIYAEMSAEQAAAAAPVTPAPAPTPTTPTTTPAAPTTTTSPTTTPTTTVTSVGSTPIDPTAPVTKTPATDTTPSATTTPTNPGNTSTPTTISSNTSSSTSNTVRPTGNPSQPTGISRAK